MTPILKGINHTFLFQAIRNSLRELCRCHGMSGSCSLQTCWKSMNAFSVISEVIKRMYDNSVIVQLDNFGRIDEKNIQEDQLVYITGKSELIKFFQFGSRMMNHLCASLAGLCLYRN